MCLWATLNIFGMRFFLLFLLLPLFNCSWAQITIVKGNICDSIDARGIDGVHVVLRNLKGTMEMGAVTNSVGDFSFECQSRGKMVLKVSKLGYAEKVIPITGSNDSVSVGTILLRKSDLFLEEVFVKGSRPFLLRKFDREIYNIKESASASSPTIVELLRKIPGVSIDVESNEVKYHNASVMLHLNNKPADRTYKKVEFIPVDNIYQIEVIEPSMRGKGDGAKGGIINIKTKQQTDDGLSGYVSTKVGFLLKDGDDVNPARVVKNFNLNYKRGSNLLYANFLSHKVDGYNKKRTTGRTNVANDFFFVDEEEIGLNNYGIDRANIGWQYFFSSKSNLSITFDIGIQESKDIVRSVKYISDRIDIEKNNSSLQKENAEQKFGGISLDYVNSIDSIGKEIIVNSYFDVKQLRKKQQSTFVNLISLENNYYRSNVTKPENSQVILYGFYNHPINDRTRWSLELNSFNIFNLEEEKNTLLNEEVSNDFSGSSKVNYFDNSASFRMGGDVLKKFRLDAGLSIQNNNYEGRFLRFEEKDTLYQVEGNYYFFLPSLSLKYRINDNSNLKFSFNKNIEVPWVLQLCDFIDKSNPSVWRQGNSSLKESSSLSYFVGYSFLKRKFNLSSLLFRRERINEIVDVSFLMSNGKYLFKPYNVGKEISHGVNISLGSSLFKNNGNISLEGNFYNKRTTIGRVEEELHSYGISSGKSSRNNFQYDLKCNFDVFLMNVNMGLFLSFQNNSLTYFGSKSQIVNSSLFASRKFFDEDLRLSLSLENWLYKLSSFEITKETIGAETLTKIVESGNFPSFLVSLVYNINKGHRKTNRKW